MSVVASLFSQFLLYYSITGALVLISILDEIFIKGSFEVFISLAGKPAFLKFIGVLLAWPLVLGYVLVKCLRLKRVDFKLNRQRYRMVEVQERRGWHYEVEKAVQLLGWRYWRPVVDLNDQPLQFKSQQELGAYMNGLHQELLDQEFKVTRTPGNRFARV